ncbi:MAG: ATP-dependent 6-phosphofructokinase [Deltaproteobacteria bacterium]|nr:ATP-dependent 6-phosphofructokinase [Deltaproteobacteria bacterium]
MKGTIGILTGGGDVPGLNQCIKMVVNRGTSEGYRVIGIRRGWDGLVQINPDDPETIARQTMELTPSTVRIIDRTGGTYLHTSRTNPSRMHPEELPPHVDRSSLQKVSDKTGKTEYYDLTPQAIKNLEKLSIDILVPIGGDDTLSYAVTLDKMGIPVICIPKTMDNDVFGTDFCIGFSTAVTRSINFIHDLRTSSGSHERITVVELFGRNSGETALISSYLANVDRAVISEVPFDMEKLARFLVEDKINNPSAYSIMVISEGAIPLGGSVMEEGEEDAYGHKKLGGIGEWTAERIHKLTGHGIIYQRLAYLMRCGAPDSLDRMVATNFGTLAVELIAQNKKGLMVALKGGCYTTTPITEISRGTRRVDVDRCYDKENYRPKVISVEGLPMFLY